MAARIQIKPACNIFALVARFHLAFLSDFFLLLVHETEVFISQNFVFPQMHEVRESQFMYSKQVIHYGSCKPRIWLMIDVTCVQVTRGYRILVRLLLRILLGY
jgi:hypothetical protein